MKYMIAMIQVHVSIVDYSGNMEQAIINFNVRRVIDIPCCTDCQNADASRLLYRD